MFQSVSDATVIIFCFASHELMVDWSGRRRLQREQHELKTPQTTSCAIFFTTCLIVEEAETMSAGKRPSERKSTSTKYKKRVTAGAALWSMMPTSLKNALDSEKQA